MLRRVVACSVLLLLASCGSGIWDTSKPSTTLTTEALTVPPTDTDHPGPVGTAWNVTLVDIDGAMTGLWPDTEITLVFGSDSRLSGLTDCGEYGGSYEVEGDYNEFEAGVRDPEDGQSIRIFALGSAEGVCEDKVMDQESYYFDALRGTGRWVVANDALFLRTTDGLFLVEAESTE